MSKIAKFIGAAALALSASFGANATVVNVGSAEFNQWKSFDVDDLLSTAAPNAWIDGHTDASDARYTGDGSALSFTFTLAGNGYMKIVDTGLNGERYSIYDNGVLLGMTSVATDPGTVFLGTTSEDFDAAMKDPQFSSAIFFFSAGTHTITGTVDPASAPFGFFASTGGVLINVPEPGTIALLLVGLGLVGATRRRA